MLGLVALFIFAVATGGFILCREKDPHGSELCMWGIRGSYVLGFVGVLSGLLIMATLVVALMAFELFTEYLD
ncbi:MAG: hypothetical protein IIB03_03405 [Acidobacteria bacterium]|nr:hypothetical protein [Acidobacteriota bacterium]